MRETGSLERAARAAIARAKGRGDGEVTPDDLLAGALSTVARFGVAQIGPWAIDVRELNGADQTAELEGVASAAEPALPVESASRDSAGSPAAAPRYGDAAVAAFEEATRLAREDGSAAPGPVHLLAVLGGSDDGLMARIREHHRFTPLEWRAALARGELGTGAEGDQRPRQPAESGTGTGSGTPELLSVDQAASFLGVHAQTVRNYIRGGKLPAYRLAGERFIRVLRRDLLGLLEPVEAEEAEQETDLPVNPSDRE